MNDWHEEDIRGNQQQIKWSRGSNQQSGKQGSGKHPVGTAQFSIVSAAIYPISSLQECMRVPFYPHSLQHLFVDTDDGHSDEWSNTSLWFWFAFPWWLVILSFHMSSDHLYVSSSNRFSIFCPLASSGTPVMWMLVYLMFQRPLKLCLFCISCIILCHISALAK